MEVEFTDEQFEKVKAMESKGISVGEAIDMLFRIQKGVIEENSNLLEQKRAEINDKYEVDEGWKAGASMEDLESAMKNVELARMAVSNLENRGEIVCEFNTVILVFAETREELKERIMHIINTCKSRDILVNKSNTQALTFLKEYVGKAPAKFTHLAPLEYPLCFQQNAGATIGDTAESSVDASGNLWWSPSIGRDLS